MRICSTYTWIALTLILLDAPSAIRAQQDGTVYDEDIKLVSFKDMEYPGLARATRIQGVVVVRLKLDSAGNVVEASPVSGSKALLPDCLVNAKKWKFKPNSHKDVVIVYDFRMDEGACHDKSKSLFLLKHPNLAVITTCDPVIQ